MPRWRKGEDVVDELLERGHLQRVTADNSTAETLVAGASDTSRALPR